MEVNEGCLPLVGSSHEGVILDWQWLIAELGNKNYQFVEYYTENVLVREILKLPYLNLTFQNLSICPTVLNSYTTLENLI